MSMIESIERDYTTRPILPAVTRSLAAINAANASTLKLYALFARVPGAEQRRLDQVELARAQQSIEAMLQARPALAEQQQEEKEPCRQYV